MWAPALIGAGVVAHAAAAESAAPATVSASWTGPNGQPVANGTHDPTASPASSGSSVGAGASDGSSASLEQTISVSILPGPLTVSPASESVDFTRTHGQGQGGPYHGSVAPVTVADARGSLVGWSATVTLQSTAGLDNAQLAHARLCVTPDAVTVVAGRPTEVRSGTHSCGNVGDPVMVFFAPPNGGGGTFSDTASLTLLLPGNTRPDAVTASLAVAVH